MEGGKVGRVVVLWDFTEIAEYALAHGENIAAARHLEIELLHIVDSGVELKENYERMKGFVGGRESLVPITPTVMVGDIFTTITEYVNCGQVEIVVLGTHGMKGLQRIMGSWALKVIAGSDVPFLVVSRPPEASGYSKIVFPVDFRKENKEKLSWVLYVANMFDCTVYFYQQEVRDSYLLSRVSNNLNFAQKVLYRNNVRFELKTCHGKHFEEEVETFSQDIGANMIIITTTKNINGLDYMFGADEQKLIANREGIPVLCVNPRKAVGFNLNSLF